MVLGLFPADPLSGENKYYIFAKGTYKVGRKGCDIIIAKDKGVSRVHAEIFVDEMSSINPPQSKCSSLSCKVRIRDCSKYGTFINNNLGLLEKVHEFPDKEMSLADGNLLSFGTGNATYRLSFVPLVFWVYTLEPNQVNHPLQDKLSSIAWQQNKKAPPPKSPPIKKFQWQETMEGRTAVGFYQSQVTSWMGTTTYSGLNLFLCSFEEKARMTIS